MFKALVENSVGVACSLCTQTHLPAYFNSSLDYLGCLVQHKCCVNRYYLGQSDKENSVHVQYQHGFVLLPIFDPWLFETTDAEPTDLEDQLCMWGVYVCVCRYTHNYFNLENLS